MATIALRKIKPLKYNDILPAMMGESEVKPVFEWVDPSELYIESKYQRNIHDRSIRLIRNIIKDFSWSRFKPPVCSYGEDNKLFVIDGQHTAIAAASIPAIKKIPIMVITAATIQNRAASFLGHNRDRVAITPVQMFYSAVAAGDGTALKLDIALKETGVTLMRSIPPVWVEGQSVAANTMMELAKTRDTIGAARCLHILMDAKRAPIVSPELKAVALLCFDKDWRGRFDDKELSKVIASKSIDQWAVTTEATVRKGQNMPTSRAIAIAWFRKVPKKRRFAGDIEEG